MQTLNNLRQSIDEVDQEILNLLAMRIKLVRKVGDFKRQQGLKVRDSKREKEILEKRSEQARTLGLSREFVKKIWQTLFKEAYNIEK